MWSPQRRDGEGGGGGHRASRRQAQQRRSQAPGGEVLSEGKSVTVHSEEVEGPTNCPHKAHGVRMIGLTFKDQRPFSLLCLPQTTTMQLLCVS